MEMLIGGLVGGVIGLVVGWSMPEPLVLRNLQSKVWGFFHHTPPAA